MSTPDQILCVPDSDATTTLAAVDTPTTGAYAGVRGLCRITCGPTGGAATGVAYGFCRDGGTPSPAAYIAVGEEQIVYIPPSPMASEVYVLAIPAVAPNAATLFVTRG
jgi:hypothetical protein